MIDVVICRFEPLVAHGLAGVLGNDAGVRVVGCGVDHRRIATLLPGKCPSVAIVDERASSAILPWRRQAGVELIVLAGAPRRACGMRMLAAGASCVARNATASQIVSAVYLAAGGGRVFLPARGAHVVRRYPDGVPLLTERELRVLAGFSAGRSHSSVADELGISVVTVRKHSASLRQKLRVGTTGDLVGMPLPLIQH